MKVILLWECFQQKSSCFRRAFGEPAFEKLLSSFQRAKGRRKKHVCIVCQCGMKACAESNQDSHLLIGTSNTSSSPNLFSFNLPLCPSSNENWVREEPREEQLHCICNLLIVTSNITSPSSSNLSSFQSSSLSMSS